MVGSKPRRQPTIYPYIATIGRTNPKVECKESEELPSGIYLVKCGYFYHHDRQNGCDYWSNDDTIDDGMNCWYISTKIGEITEKNRVIDTTDIVKRVSITIYNKFTQREEIIWQTKLIQPTGYSYERAYWGNLFGKVTYVS